MVIIEKKFILSKNKVDSANKAVSTVLYIAVLWDSLVMNMEKIAKATQATLFPIRLYMKKRMK